MGSLKTTVAIISMSSLFALTACNFPAYMGSPKGPDLSQTPGSIFDKMISAEETPSFEFIKTQILEKDRTCTQCHSWASSYEKTLFYVAPGNFKGSPLVRRLKNFGGDMPKDRPALSEEAIEVLKIWIESGANEQSVKKAGPDAPPTTPVAPTFPDKPTFKDLSKLVLSTNCASCHNPDPSASASFMPVQKYSEFMELTNQIGEPFVVPGDLSQGALWRAVDQSMMPPPEDVEAGLAVALTPDQIALVKRWIEQGAPDENGVPFSPTPVTTTTTTTTTTTSTTTSSTTTTTLPSVVVPPPATEILNFETISKTILEVNCTRCHNSAASSGAKKYPLVNYQDMLAMKIKDKALLVLGDAANSVLWTIVESGKMPSAKAIEAGLVPAMTAEQKQKLQQWILQGAPEK